MRQTSRAVALLLTLQTAQAASSAITKPATVQQVPTAFSAPQVGSTSVNTASNQMSSRTAGYANRIQGTWSWTGILIKKGRMLSSETWATATTIKGSGCMLCLNQGGVWCSRTYSFLATGSVFQQSYETYTNGDMTQQAAGTDAAATSGAYDGGSCCALNTTFIGLVGATGVAAAPISYATGTTADSGLAAGQPLVRSACVAIENAAAVQDSNDPHTTNAFGASTVGVTVVAFQSWWCSNGLYNYGLTSTTGTLNGTQILPASGNQRQELAQVACPQIKAQCGDVTSILTPLTTAAVVIDVATASVLTTNDKCTWVAWSYVAAPTFTLADGAGALGVNMVSTNWEIHAMEYTTGAASADLASLGYLSQNGAVDGYVTSSVALQQSTFVPLFNMPAAQFATLRTWYGSGGATLQATTVSTSGNNGDWLSPYQNSFANTLADSALIANVMGQTWGNVANFPQSAFYSETAAVTASTSAGYTYGLVNSKKFDLRVVRYVPAQAAVSTHAAGSTLAASYTTAKTTYDAAKLTWDAYVAILVKNAKQDAFAALFSPPKSPTVPPLPNKPWAPAAYAGYVKQTPSERAIMLANTTVLASAAQPTSQQFWTSLLAAQTVGGWGSFTAQVITYRNAWSKSFGTIGYSGDSTAMSMSAVWNYKWTCTGVSTAPAQSSSATCDATYAAATDATTSTNQATNTNATVRLVSVISLWSTGNTNSVSATQTAGAWTTKQDLKLTWTPSAWSQALAGLSAIAAPVAATDATQLTGVAGAHALAASAAAALTVAAALY